MPNKSADANAAAGPQAKPVCVSTTMAAETSLADMQSVSQKGSDLDLNNVSKVSIVSYRGYVPPVRITGWVNVIFILMADLIGTGIVNLPETYNRMGWAVGLAILVSFGTLTAYAGILLWRLHMTFQVRRLAFF